MAQQGARDDDGDAASDGDDDSDCADSDDEESARVS